MTKVLTAETASKGAKVRLLEPVTGRTDMTAGKVYELTSSSTLTDDERCTRVISRWYHEFEIVEEDPAEDPVIPTCETLVLDIMQSKITIPEALQLMCTFVHHHSDTEEQELAALRHEVQVLRELTELKNLFTQLKEA